MPNTSEPDKVAALPDSDGNSTMTPLLSVANKSTGFWTCAVSDSAVTWQEVEAQSQYNPGLVAPVAVQALPQSCANGPMPRIPFDPKACNVSSSGTPLEAQAAGTVANVGSITCTGTLLACSPERVMSAVFTGPQVRPLTKPAHSPIGLPSRAFCCGNDKVKAPPPADDKSR